MKRIASLILCAAACALAFAAQPADKVKIPDRPILLQGGPGIAISGSGTTQQLPDKARTFLDKYYSGTKVDNIRLNFVKGTSEVKLDDGTEISFGKDGSVTDIRQGGNRSINTDALSEIVAPNVYLHLIEVGDIQNVNMVKNAEGSGTCVMLINTTPSQLIFDVDGNFIITAG